MTTVNGRKLDRIPRWDNRNRAFGMVRAQTLTLPLVTHSYKYRAVLDQGPDGACTGFGTADMLQASPIPQVDTATYEYAFGLYDLAKTQDEWPGECVDTETQCLTRRGWLGPADLIPEQDEILTFDIQTETTRWAVLEKVHQYESAPYRVWSQKGFAAAATDNHRWPVRVRPNGSDFARPYRMTTTAEWRSGDEFPRAAPCSDLPATPKHDDDFVELVAWVICEGSYRRLGTGRGQEISVSQKVHRARVAELMVRLGVAPGRTRKDGCHDWTLSGDLARQVRAAAPDRAPQIGWLGSLTLRQLRLFLEVCVLADGHQVPAKGLRRGGTTFAQKPGPILDSWLAACAMAGTPVQRAVGTSNVRSAETWTMRGRNSVEPRRLTSSPYQYGPVWCPQTSVGTFVARRDGSVFITGNSYDGSSVLGAMKAAKLQGRVASYVWMSDATEVALAVGYHGPVVVGVDWYNNMFTPDPQTFRLSLGGGVAGGHCVCLIGYSAKSDYFTLLNSWGPEWGMHGTAYLKRGDLDILLKGNGEAALAKKVRQP